PRARAVGGDEAEQQKDAAAQQVEAEELAQRMGMDEQAVKAKADQRGARQSGEGRRTHEGGRSGGPRTSMGSDTAMESVMKTSMNTISGFGAPAGERGQA